jgi:hypothetical protein
LGPGGSALWDDITATHDLDEGQRVQLSEACRAKDRLDKLDQLLRTDVDVWARIVHRAQTKDYELVIDKALAQANATASVMKQLLAALRLPDEVSGRRPQQRGGGRGVHVPSGASARDRLRSVAN